MSARLSRGTHLIVTAKRAARGGTVEERATALMALKVAELPPLATVGIRKFEAARMLKEAGLALARLPDEVRAEAADRVVEMADAYGEMPNMPNPPHTEVNGRVGMRRGGR